MKALTAGGVLLMALAITAAGWFVRGFDAARQPARLYVVIESPDESPFGIAEHRRPPRPAQRSAAAAEVVVASPASTIEQLKATGDPRDAFIAFRLIARCVRAREVDDQMKSLPLGPAFAAEREAYGDGRQRIHAACQDITPAQIAARLPLAEKAARAGVLGAVTAWIEQGPFGDRTALEQRPDDPLVTAWVEQAIERVKAAARRDDVEAIIQLGMLSLNWELDEIGRLKVLVGQAAGRELRD